MPPHSRNESQADQLKASVLADSRSHLSGQRKTSSAVRRVQVITYNFPADGAVGRHRWAGLSKYLAPLGWCWPRRAARGAKGSLTVGITSGPPHSTHLACVLATQGPGAQFWIDMTRATRLFIRAMRFARKAHARTASASWEAGSLISRGVSFLFNHPGSIGSKWCPIKIR